MLEITGLIVKPFGSQRSLGLLAACVLSVFQTQSSALSRSIAAQPSDLICYMQNNSGSVINLSRFCAGGRATIALSSTDQRFLELYERSLEKQSGGLRSVQAALSEAQQNPRLVVERAQAVCTTLRESQPQPTSRRANRDILATIALEYYCPELDE